MPEMDGFEFLEEFENQQYNITNTDFDHYAFLFSRSQRQKRAKTMFM
jgi:CheY-like chemotaxis protein